MEEFNIRQAGISHSKETNFLNKNGTKENDLTNWGKN